MKAPFATKTLDRVARDASTTQKIQATDVSGLHPRRPIELTDHQASQALVRDALTRGTGTDVIVASPDLHEVVARLGVDTAESTHLTGTLDEALDDLETLITYRARTTSTLPARSSPRPVLLIAHRPDDQRRLQALLELGAQFAVSAALLPSQRHDDPIGRATVAAPGAARDRSGSHEPETSSPTTVQPRAAKRASIPASPPAATNHPANSEATREPNANTKAAAETPRTAEIVTAAPLQLRVLGPVGLTHVAVAESSSDISERPVSLGPKKRELLAFPAVHPDGVAREELIDALWPDAPIDRPQNALHATLTRLRADIAKSAGLPAAQLVVHDHDRYRLNAQLVDVDLHHLGTAQRRENAGLKIDRDQDRRQLLRAYKDLAADISAAWIVVPRENLRRDALDAAVALAHAASTADPRSALDLLERARDIDPYNEQIYRGIMRLQRRLGRTSAIRQTLAILAAQLRDIDSTPQPATISLADALTNTGTSPERHDSSAAGQT